MATTIEAALEEHKTLLKKLWVLEGEVKATLEREAILKGRIEQLEQDLADSKERAEHYLRWNVEITRHIHSIGMFVSDALNMARNEVEQGNGSAKVMREAEQAIEKALEIGHESVHSETDQRRIPGNQTDRRS
jgi:sugar-specific transcriptional regulator TrmB